jgi:hypothetical protein
MARVPGPAAPAITAAVTTPDGNGSVTLTGQTYRRAKVGLQVNGTNVQTTRSNARGRFLLTFTVGPGSTTVRVSATAHGHRPTSITMTVNRTQTPTNQPGNPQPGNPQPGNPQPAVNFPPGTYQLFDPTSDGQDTLKTEITLTVDSHGSGTMQFVMQTLDYPFDMSSLETNEWDWKGQWKANGSGLEFVGSGTRTRTSVSNPSLNGRWSFLTDMVFPFYQWNPGQGTLDLILSDDFGSGVPGPKGQTRKVILTKIA